MSKRLRLACFSPLPPQRSGIADYSAALLPYLAQQFAIELYVDEPEQIAWYWTQRFPVHSIADFLARPALRWRYDLRLYQMGNQPLYHEQIYEALMRSPGVVVFHEINLLGFYLHRRAAGAGPAAFIREMGYAYGLSGIQAARTMLSDVSARKTYTFPLFKRIAAVSQGLIVHTHAARTQILREVPHARVIAIPLAAHAMAGELPAVKPDWLASLPAEAVVLASFGYIAPSKRIDRVLQAIAQVRNASQPLYYVLVGEPVDQYDLVPLIHDLGLEDRVHITGFVDDATFEAYLRLIDVGVNLRTGPSSGEMSAGVVRLLAAGRPTIVSNVGGFAELPSQVVIKIDQDHTEVDQLVTALRRLVDDPTSRTVYGMAARHYAEQELALPQIALQYGAFIRDCCSPERLAAARATPGAEGKADNSL